MKTPHYEGVVEPELDAFSYQNQEVVLCHQQSLLKEFVYRKKEYTDLLFSP